MPLTVPVLISEGFGTGDGDKTYPIPVASQIGIKPGAASFADGFPPLTRTALDAGGIPPNGEDVNGILYMLSAHMALINSGQPYLYDAGQATAIGGYGQGAVVQKATLDGFWLNTVNGNTSNPDAGGAGWVPLTDLGETSITISSGTVTLTQAQAAHPLIAFNGTLTGNVTVNFPQNVGQSWTVAAYTDGAFNITLQTATAGNQVRLVSAGTGGGYDQAQNVFVASDMNLWSNNVSTAGLAPLANPNFTGVPTAPTAAGTSNTTQVATTAFAQSAIALAIAGLAPKASPTLTGSPTAPTPATGNNSALLATTQFVQTAVSSVPTQAPGTNNTAPANTAFVQAAIAALAPTSTVPKIHTGTFTCSAGVTAVAFGVTFAAVPKVFVQWNYPSPDAGWIVPGSITTTGFSYQNGNAGTCEYMAVVGNF